MGNLKNSKNSNYIRKDEITKKNNKTNLDNQANIIAKLMDSGIKPDNNVTKKELSDMERAEERYKKRLAHVTGSSAGASSGDFHVYRAEKRREEDRLLRMEQEQKNEDEIKDLLETKNKLKEDEEKRQNHNKRRRRKRK